MPKKRSNGAEPDWTQLYELAAPQAGYFRLDQAALAGFSGPLLNYYMRARRVEKAARGIFRLAHYPPSDHEDLVVVWLWAERLGVFSHETALVLHLLSDALPANQHMTVPTAWQHRRLRVPRNLVLHFADLAQTDRAWVGPIPVTTPLRTIVDCSEAHAQPDLVQQAAAQAVNRGLLTRDDIPVNLRRGVRQPQRPARWTR